MLISGCSVAGCKCHLIEEVHAPLHIPLREVGKSDCFRRPSFLCLLSVLQLPPAEVLDLTSQYQCSASLLEEDHRCHRAESSAYSTQVHDRPPPPCTCQDPEQPVIVNSVHDPFCICIHQTWVLFTWHCAPTHRLHLRSCWHLSRYTQANSSKYTHAAATSCCITPTETSHAVMSLCINGQKSGTKRMHKGK